MKKYQAKLTFFKKKKKEQNKQTNKQKQNFLEDLKIYPSFPLLFFFQPNPSELSSCKSTPPIYHDIVV